jgi:hypothetical protein
VSASIVGCFTAVTRPPFDPAEGRHHSNGRGAAADLANASHPVRYTFARSAPPRRDRRKPTRPQDDLVPWVTLPGDGRIECGYLLRAAVVNRSRMNWRKQRVPFFARPPPPYLPQGFSKLPVKPLLLDTARQCAYFERARHCRVDQIINPRRWDIRGSSGYTHRAAIVAAGPCVSGGPTGLTHCKKDRETFVLRPDMRPGPG